VPTLTDFADCVFLFFFFYWAGKNFTLTLLSGHQAVCAYFPLPKSSCSSWNWATFGSGLGLSSGSEFWLGFFSEIHSWNCSSERLQDFLEARGASYAILGLLTIRFCRWSLSFCTSLSIYRRLFLAALPCEVRNSVNL